MDCFAQQFGFLGEVRIVGYPFRSERKMYGVRYATVSNLPHVARKAKVQTTCFVGAHGAGSQPAGSCTLHVYASSISFMPDVFCDLVRWVKRYDHSTVSDAFYFDICDYIGVESMFDL